MKVQWNEGGGRILLGDKAGGGADKLRPVRHHCIGACQSLGLVAQCTGSAHVRAFFMLCQWNVTQHISGFLGAISFAEKKVILNYVTWSDLLNWLQTCDATCVWRIDERVMVGLCVWCYGGPVCMVLWICLIYELGKLVLGRTQETHPDLIFLGNFKPVLPGKSSRKHILVFRHLFRLAIDICIG